MGASRPPSPPPLKRAPAAGTCLLLQNQSQLCPGQTNPPRPICSSATGTDAGIWQLRPRRTHRARSWHRGSATCQHTFPASRAQLSGICQVPAPLVAAAGPRPAIRRPGPGAWGTPSGLSSMSPLRWVASVPTHGRGSRQASQTLSWARLPERLPSASSLLSTGEEFCPGLPPRTGSSRENTGSQSLPLPPGPGGKNFPDVCLGSAQPACLCAHTSATGPSLPVHLAHRRGRRGAEGHRWACESHWSPDSQGPPGSPGASSMTSRQLSVARSAGNSASSIQSCHPVQRYRLAHHLSFQGHIMVALDLPGSHSLGSLLTPSRAWEAGGHP